MEDHGGWRLMTQYIAVTPLVIARDETGRDVYVYNGQPVPGNVSDESVERLVEDGFIAAIFEPEVEVEDAPQVEVVKPKPAAK